MKHSNFRQALITPLFRMSVWILDNTTDDGEEHFATYYITDDYGNAVAVRSVLSLWNWDNSLRAAQCALWH